jgi:hypothetical protein
MSDAADLIAEIAAFIAAYRAAGLDPAAMLVAVGRTFPGSTLSDYAIGLAWANRERGPNQRTQGPEAA